MLTDIITLALAIAGIFFFLFIFMFKLIVWQEEHFTLTLPLKDCDKIIFDRLLNLRSFCEFLGIHKKTTVVLINYGVPDWFLIKLRALFNDSEFLKIVSRDEDIF